MDEKDKNQEFFYNFTCGQFHQKRNHIDAALRHFDNVLKIRPGNHRALHYRSLLHTDLANDELALVDAIEAWKKSPSIKTSVRYGEAVHMSNQFEEAKVKLHNLSRDFPRANLNKFNNRLHIVDVTILDTVGDSLTPFFIQNAAQLAKIYQKIKELEFVDSRQKWKIRRAEGKCDITSLHVPEEEILNPLTIARRARLYNIFNQIYYQKSWVDMKFLKSLKTNKSFNMTLSKKCTPHLKEILQKKYSAAYKFMLTLHARSPLYNEYYKRQSKKSNSYYNFQQSALNNIQYQTRRQCFIILKSIHKFRDEKQIIKMIDYIEDVVSKYIACKTNRILPWKTEFLYELYNLVALTYCDQLDVPTFTTEDSRECQLILYGLDSDSPPSKTFVFGVRSTYEEPDKTDFKYIKYKNRLRQLEYRLRFSKLAIERAYLNHEICSCHLSQGKFDECKTVAVRSVQEAKKCSSNIWKFLGYFQLCKPFIINQQIELLQKSLEKLNEAALRLKEPKLQKFVDACITLNDEDLLIKKITKLPVGISFS